jgi:hypothetical protein
LIRGIVLSPRRRGAEHESEGAIVRRALRVSLQQKGVMKSERKRAVICKRP